MFESESVQDMIYYKWNTYAYKIHYTGAFAHFFYIVMLTIYIYQTYLVGTFGEVTSIVYPILMIVGILYPFLYDTTQLCKSGISYFDDPWNYSDFIF